MKTRAVERSHEAAVEGDDIALIRNAAAIDVDVPRRKNELRFLGKETLRYLSRDVGSDVAFHGHVNDERPMVAVHAIGVEIGADVLLKATKVDGVFSEDPVRNPAAVRYDSLSYPEAIDRRLQVMDMTAFTMGMDNRLPIVVFNVTVPGNLARALRGETVGTRVLVEV